MRHLKLAIVLFFIIARDLRNQPHGRRQARTDTYRARYLAMPLFYKRLQTINVKNQLNNKYFYQKLAATYFLARYLSNFKTISQLKNLYSMNDNTKVVVALLAGLAAGAALGLLFAPDRGSETRDKLSESLKNLGDSIKDTAAAEIDNLVGFKDKVVDSIKTKIKGAEEEYQDDLEHA